MYKPNDRFITIKPPPGCHTPYDNLTQGRLLWPNHAWAPEAKYEVRYLEDTYDIAGMQFFNYSGYKGETTPGTICNNNRQHFWYIAGSSTNGTWDEITLLHCIPYIEALFMYALFSLPTFQLVSSASIIPDETTATPFSNASSAEDIQEQFFEHFTEALENGTRATPFSELTGIANVDKFIDRIDHLYRIWTAQSLHFYFRHPANVALPTNTTNNPAAAHLATDTYHGILTDRTRLRLVQNEVSTRILQSLLVAMVLCVVLACILEPHTRILPKDPGSIAAKMSLFAGGKVWRKVPEGAERWSDDEIKRKGVLRGVGLRMGWCEGEREEEGGHGGRWFGVDGKVRDSA